MCCEHFHPSVGGVQKMIYEIGQAFIREGHEVTVASGWRADRVSFEIDGIKIEHFKVTGNTVSGLKGEVEKYQKLLVEGSFDMLLVQAAQQWSLDAMLPVLEKIPYQKFHIPCGYSGFYMDKYSEYYKKMESYLPHFDHLIYNSGDYRDYNFAKGLGLSNLHVVPAAAAESEFGVIDEGDVREKLGISKETLVFTSVGSPPFNKGHFETLKAYLTAKIEEDSVLILNGPYHESLSSFILNNLNNPKAIAKEIIFLALGKSTLSIKRYAQRNKVSNKKVFFTNYDRKSVISLFFTSDIFLFASHIEYSPLVIYECCAAGLPFISVPVGNVEELAKWSQAGIISQARKDEVGYTRCNPADLAKTIEQVYSNKEELKRMSENGRKTWKELFNWDKFVAELLKLYQSGAS